MAGPAAVLSENRPRAGMHRLTLRFPGELESQFMAEYAHQSAHQVRIGLVVAVGLFVIFGVVDMLTPEVGPQVLYFRYGVALLLLVGLALTFSRHFERIIQPFTAA